MYLAAGGIKPKGLWFGKTCLQGQTTGYPGSCTALDCIDLVITHLAVPGRGERGAGYPVTGKNNRAVVHHCHLIGALHGLPTGEPAETGDMASGVLVLGTHINEVERFLRAPGHHGL